MTAQLSFVEEARTCEWCTDPIPRSARKDSVTCSKSCRQARHRFRLTPATETAASPIRVAYLDPPYPKLASYYRDHPDYAGEVDHDELVRRATREFPDGWALSTSKRALPFVLRLPAMLELDPDDLLVSVWVKGSRACVSKRARSAYEPVVFWRGRERRLEIDEVLDDVLTWGGRQPSHPGALVGMKSAAFCEWVFRQLGLMRGDELADLFPGSGAVSRAWRIYSGEPVVVSAGDPWNLQRVARRRATKASRLEESQR